MVAGIVAEVLVEVEVVVVVDGVVVGARVTVVVVAVVVTTVVDSPFECRARRGGVAAEGRTGVKKPEIESVRRRPPAPALSY